MLNFVHYLPTKLYFGKGQIENLRAEVAQYGKKVLMVYGGGSIKRNDIYGQVMEQLEGFTVFELAGIKPNPRLDTCKQGIALCKQKGIDLVLAVGGGSAMDTAKCIAVGAKYDGDVWDFYIKKATPEQALPVGCVVTIAATGSQYNPLSVISNTQTKQKMPLNSYVTAPRFSILDPEYTFTVPKDQTAYGCADMLIHDMDQYFSKTPGTPIQDGYAEALARTIIENAPIALQNPTNYDARANLLWADAWAMSQTCNRGKVADSTTHGLEHEISAYYDITHGLGVAIIWPNWARYVYKSCIPKFAQFAKNVWGLSGEGKTDEELALAGIEKTDEFFRSLGIPKTLTEIGIGDEHFEDMAKAMVGFRGLCGWDKQLDVDACMKIYRDCLV